MSKEPTEFVVTQAVWFRVSSDYQAERGLRTLVVKPETTVAEIMRWAAHGHLHGPLLGRGDVVITAPDVHAYNFELDNGGDK